MQAAGRAGATVTATAGRGLQIGGGVGVAVAVGVAVGVMVAVGVGVATAVGVAAVIVRSLAKTPRPWVKANNRVPVRLRTTSVTTTFGRPACSHAQALPPTLVLNTPTSVPTYTICPSFGSIVTALAGASGRPALTSVQTWPPLVVFQTWPVLKPETVR